MIQSGWAVTRTHVIGEVFHHQLMRGLGVSGLMRTTKHCFIINNAVSSHGPGGALLSPRGNFSDPRTPIEGWVLTEQVL